MHTQDKRQINSKRFKVKPVSKGLKPKPIPKATLGSFIKPNPCNMGNGPRRAPIYKDKSFRLALSCGCLRLPIEKPFLYCKLEILPRAADARLRREFPSQIPGPKWLGSCWILKRKVLCWQRVSRPQALASEEPLGCHIVIEQGLVCLRR